MNKILDKLRNPKVFGAMRHFLSTAGGALATKGVVASSEWELWTGIGLAGLSVVMSWTAKEKAK
ncbi:hypothetical protein PXK30_09545 [Phaeobacter gallaeciensis]|uniref:Pam3-gp28 family putative phage holin n=1 Tax=Phaeobacter gallaeciensis TaxID=60890 RepID=UPI00237FAD12|nr:hypothetical protein [Phaeobacter gallaeciensis]MDE4303634.1 hypothetical protein [Phaeobacter gallaeciensis]MDE4307884.1 hypothetical protein [Phaeobacter gallaeciensis]MDE4312342.1 hypothetical protein [Phaeobacter gallaeciensis]MDE4316813.1 hypothetical protein [Phaeobacter gallaeciensis]MDE4321276.1 hypothetical protein [Phaeobacter gallaeciensis]